MQVTDRLGPDTGTWSMHTVGWLELNEKRKANDMFQMLLRNINGPFKVKHTYLSIIMFNLDIDV